MLLVYEEAKKQLAERRESRLPRLPFQSARRLYLHRLLLPHFSAEEVEQYLGGCHRHRYISSCCKHTQSLFISGLLMFSEPR